MATDLNLARLRDVADAWNDGQWLVSNAFNGHFDPPTVLALLDAIEVLQARLARVAAVASGA